MLAEGNWSGMEVEWKSVGAKLKVIKMAQMAKSLNGVDIIYEWKKYDAKIDTICIMFASENGEQLYKIRYGGSI